MVDRPDSPGNGLRPTSLLDPEKARALATLLSTWQTVDRRLVHKSALSEVFLTDLTKLADDLYAMAAQWPRWHSYFRPIPDGPAHPLLFVESLRQAGIFLTHQFLGCPSAPTSCSCRSVHDSRRASPQAFEGGPRGVGGPGDWPDVREIDLAFSRYAELHVPTLLTSRSVRRTGDEVVSVTITQEDHPVATGTVRISRPATDGAPGGTAG